jgi:hypothetical protein
MSAIDRTTRWLDRHLIKREDFNRRNLIAVRILLLGPIARPSRSSRSPLSHVRCRRWIPLLKAIELVRFETERFSAGCRIDRNKILRRVYWYFSRVLVMHRLSFCNINPIAIFASVISFSTGRRLKSWQMRS